MSGPTNTNTLAPPPFQLQANPVQRVEEEAEKTTAPYEPKAGDKITKSVGKGGVNAGKDVRIVQYNLIQKGYLPSVDADGKSSITGVCDAATIFAIRQIQTQVVEAKDLDSKVDPGGSIEKALNGEISSKRDELTADTGFIDQIQQNYPNGINVALWANYTNQSSNNKEFKRAADKYATQFNSVGFDDSGKLHIGMARPITTEAETINAINDIHKLLLSEYEKKEQMCVLEAPAFTKIKTLALFAHGMPWGMHMSSGGNYNMRIDSEKETNDFEMFVKAIKGPLKDDVDVNLMSCNAGRESDGTEKNDVWHMSDAEKQDGSSSFGAKFAEELGEDASVYAHLSAGHTVNNYSARVFGADAGKDATKDQGGVHIFRLLYNDAYVTSEATRLGKDKKKVEDHMYKHYKKRMSDSHSGNFSVPGAEGEEDRKVNQLGAEMFSDLEGTTTMLHTDWTTWVKDNPVP
jgi:hypothetical protein